MTSSSWPVSIIKDPLVLKGRQVSRSRKPVEPISVLSHSCITHAKIPIADIVVGRDDDDSDCWEAFQEGGRAARVALADYVSRLLCSLSAKKDGLLIQHGGYDFQLQKLDRKRASSSGGGNRRRDRSNANGLATPFVLERTDVWCDCDGSIHVFLRVLVHKQPTDDDTVMATDDDDIPEVEITKIAVSRLLQLCLSTSGDSPALGIADLMNHVATAVLQDRMRSQLAERWDAVAFVADGAILPRRSGASSAPMASPPAVPFKAPSDNSPMARTIDVDVGKLRWHLTSLPRSATSLTNGYCSSNKTTVVTLSGLLVPRGVSLIVGGGYHGKSTLLRTIACGVYNKVPGDGREYCVTVNDALTVRAEDGKSTRVI